MYILERYLSNLKGKRAKLAKISAKGITINKKDIVLMTNIESKKLSPNIILTITSPKITMTKNIEKNEHNVKKINFFKIWTVLYCDSAATFDI